ncbi:lipoprotein [Glaciimonas sp. PCH181]|uniref:LPS translocon maturation chaperone LptM n=1 Tax=Glaciimonas sp. PCH181 TaxID=2133943 RepID=UPI000D367619|nr:lipoprotein [Glaciimonas sp. PCH181]PUA17575.1 hypothetical protein C7W93_16945 [Glaciimonas sp. PCH181]
MKPLFDLPRVVILGSALAFSLLLTACGQKGPLYMPKIPPLATKPAAPAAAPPKTEKDTTAGSSASDTPTMAPVAPASTPSTHQ